MSSQRQSDTPSPTIVGPRPEDARGVKISIPNGIERVLALAGINEGWRAKILADPCGAAAEAGIDLAASEKAILKSLPRPALERMAAPFAAKAPTISNGLKAAGLAAAALLATAVPGIAQSPPAPTGIRPDLPPQPHAATPAPGMEKPQAPPIAWLDSLDDALAKAKESRRAVMAVFLLPDIDVRPVPIAGATPAMAQQDKRRLSQGLLLSDEANVRGAVKDANLLAVKVTKPAATGKDAEQKSAAYQTLLKKYDLDGKLPAVVFLAPDGSEMRKSLVQPTDQTSWVTAIRAVPGLLAGWFAAQMPREKGTAAGGGVRADLPAMPSTGIRSDVPPDKR